VEKRSHLRRVSVYPMPSTITQWTSPFLPKHHYPYLHAFDSGTELREGLAEWVRFYKHDRGYSSLDDRTPDEVYYGLLHPFADAA
jgi:transposase InsO family protein